MAVGSSEKQVFELNDVSAVSFRSYSDCLTFLNTDSTVPACFEAANRGDFGINIEIWLVWYKMHSELSTYRGRSYSISSCLQLP